MYFFYLKEQLIFSLKETGTFKAKIDIIVPRASITAIEQIEKNGGSIKCVYYGHHAILAMRNPERYPDPMISMPPPKLFKWYMRSDIRGYLADSDPLHPLRDVVPREEEEADREKSKMTELYLKTKGKKTAKIPSIL